MNQSPSQVHRRRNPLTGEWVLVSPHRTARPWTGQQEHTEEVRLPPHDPNCYLCPGNTRAGGKTNPPYTDTFVFSNDFAALHPPPETSPAEKNPSSCDHNHDLRDRLFTSRPEHGICRVICYSPRHDLSMARMTGREVQAIVECWIDEYRDLSSRPQIANVQIFENRGLQMGCSNPHPHGQIWATSSIPDLVQKEVTHQQDHFDACGKCLLCQYLEEEERRNERLLFTNSSFVCLVPYWAVWPYETMIIPRFHAGDILELNRTRQQDLAEILIRLSIRYDNLFHTPFPLSMGIHQAPCDGREYSGFHFHLHFYPPLLRSATVRKHMVGFEMLGMAQRDITPETAAASLGSLSDTHYLETGRNR